MKPSILWVSITTSGLLVLPEYIAVSKPSVSRRLNTAMHIDEFSYARVRYYKEPYFGY